ncbi:RNA polymerase sigma factor [Echinicola sp. 20G]|uniref:RNA polymerase sigma factor n=1 Tax=Echinicola sp. 20G TaxID=2781961 RepID=UPI001F441CCB|nr:RNA polymerase sigma-70 factor [Echinicola sp. 20G]
MRPLKDHGEKELILLLRQGDIFAFDELYFRYINHLMAFAVSYIKDPIEAEEAVQEVFIRIWENRGRLDSNKSFRAYLFKSVKNSLINLIRDSHEKLQLDDAPDTAVIIESKAINNLVFEELEIKVLHLISELPEVQQQVFKLSKLEGLSNAQIAKKLNLSKRTIEHHIYLATKNLKSQLLKSTGITSLFLIHLFT